MHAVSIYFLLSNFRVFLNICTAVRTWHDVCHSAALQKLVEFVILEETKEELLNFTISFDLAYDLAALQASKSKESQWKQKQQIALWEL